MYSFSSSDFFICTFIIPCCGGESWESGSKLPYYRLGRREACLLCLFVPNNLLLLVRPFPARENAERHLCSMSLLRTESEVSCGCRLQSSFTSSRAAPWGSEEGFLRKVVFQRWPMRYYPLKRQVVALRCKQKPIRRSSRFKSYVANTFERGRLLAAETFPRIFSPTQRKASLRRSLCRRSEKP